MGHKTPTLPAATILTLPFPQSITFPVKGPRSDTTVSLIIWGSSPTTSCACSENPHIDTHLRRVPDSAPLRSRAALDNLTARLPGFSIRNPAALRIAFSGSGRLARTDTLFPGTVAVFSTSSDRGTCSRVLFPALSSRATRHSTIHHQVPVRGHLPCARRFRVSAVCTPIPRLSEGYLEGVHHGSTRTAATRLLSSVQSGPGRVVRWAMVNAESLHTLLIGRVASRDERSNTGGIWRSAASLLRGPAELRPAMTPSFLSPGGALFNASRVSLCHSSFWGVPTRARIFIPLIHDHDLAPCLSPSSTRTLGPPACLHSA